MPKWQVAMFVLAGLVVIGLLIFVVLRPQQVIASGDVRTGQSNGWDALIGFFGAAGQAVPGIVDRLDNDDDD